jgi:hypothetical protein
MKLDRSTIVHAAMAALALVALGAATGAQARDNVHWSVGIHAAPGVSVGFGNVPPLVAAPVYVAPQPVYLAPQPVYVAPRYVVRPAPVYGPVYYGPPAVVYVKPKHRHKHWRHRH